MGRFRKHLYENFQNENFNSDERYELAYKRVKRIKAFYIHALIYLITNVFIIIGRYNKSELGSEVFFEWKTFSTAFFWGIGLVAHGLSVFGRNLFFSADWEERKIKEFMEKEKKQKWE